MCISCTRVGVSRSSCKAGRQAGRIIEQNECVHEVQSHPCFQESAMHCDFWSILGSTCKSLGDFPAHSNAFPAAFPSVSTRTADPDRVRLTHICAAESQLAANSTNAAPGPFLFRHSVTRKCLQPNVSCMAVHLDPTMRVMFTCM